MYSTVQLYYFRQSSEAHKQQCSATDRCALSITRRALPERLSRVNRSESDAANDSESVCHSGGAISSSRSLLENWRWCWRYLRISIAPAPSPILSIMPPRFYAIHYYFHNVGYWRAYEYYSYVYSQSKSLLLIIGEQGVLLFSRFPLHVIPVIQLQLNRGALSLIGADAHQQWVLNRPLHSDVPGGDKLLIERLDYFTLSCLTISQMLLTIWTVRD